MASVTVFSCIAVACGLLLALKVGRALHIKRVADVLGLFFVTGFLGGGLALVAGFAHATCSDILKLCAPTTDTTVWAVSYPILAVPAYWLVALLAPTADESDGGHVN